MPPYPTLTDDMKTFLVNNVNQNQYEDRIVHYHINGDVRFPDEFPRALPDTIARINAKIDAIINVPDPKEASDWETVSNLATQALSLAQTLNETSPIVSINKIIGNINDAIGEVNKYIATWSNKKTKDNHLVDADKLISQLNTAVKNAERIKCRKEWDTVNKFNYENIIEYLRRNPHTPFLKEADECLWSITQSEVADMDFPPTTFSLGKILSTIKIYKNDAVKYGLFHSEDADKLLKQFETQGAGGFPGAGGQKPTWREVFQFIQNNPESPFKEKAQDLLYELVEKEVDKMRENPASYNPFECIDLISNGLVNKYDLMGENLITEDSYDKMTRGNEFVGAHPIPNPKGDYFEDSENENITDIFLFGIPATGKTSILMGLVQSGKFQFNSVNADGEYGEILQNYVDNGIMPPQTLNQFVAVCTGSVNDSKGISHAVNIIDMAGGAFAYEIARNPQGIVSFADMGHSAAQLLSSKHRKLFFIIIDPTSDKVILQRDIYQYDDEGNPINLRIEKIPVYQNQTINRLVNLFSDPRNSTIMKRVDGIHFLMTKADTLDPSGEGMETKESNGLKKINNNRYKPQVEHIKKLCSKDNLDLPAPRLLFFSLGKFFVGNVFEYDSSDADAIFDMVAEGSVGIAKDGLWDKIVSFCAKPLF